MQYIVLVILLLTFQYYLKTAFWHTTAIYAERCICYRPSICLSHGWISQKRFEVRIMQLLLQSSPVPLVFVV